MLHSYVTDMAARVTPNTQIPKYCTSKLTVRISALFGTGAGYCVVGVTRAAISLTVGRL